MTIRESSICSVVQSFPILLILAQKYDKCLKTPLIYEPPKATPSPEYYEALDALFNNLFGHGYPGHDPSHSGCVYGHSTYGHGTYGYGKKSNQKYAVASPCHIFSASPHSYDTHTYPSVSSGYPYYDLKLSGTGAGGYKGTYAPTQVYSPNHKYKIVIKKNKKRRPQKLQMEHCVVADRAGECVLVDSCDPYVRLLRHQQWKPSPALTRFLQDWHCGFENTLPKVCCPILKKTPGQVPTKVVSPAELEKSAAEFRKRLIVRSIPEPPVCGFSNASFSRVVGGVDAKPGDFPWMALLGYERQGITMWNCGGSLVTSKHVLTAAHCIHNQEKRLYVVRLGELDLSRTDEEAAPVDIAIMKMIMHEQYDSTSGTNDIGLVVMDREVEFTDRIHPICLPRSMELRANNFERYNPIVAGWGNLEYEGLDATSVQAATSLQAAQIPVVTNAVCEEAYKNFPKQVIDERVLCAGNTEGGNDACGGDSGGPLMQPIWHPQSKTTYFHQIGLVSFGKKCGEAVYPGVYTRMTAFMPWIEEKLLGTTPTKE